VILIAVIIALRGVLGCVGFDQFWSFADVQEVTLHPVTEIILFAVVGPFALFMIALLFIVAGILTRPSVLPASMYSALSSANRLLGNFSFHAASAIEISPAKIANTIRVFFSGGIIGGRPITSPPAQTPIMPSQPACQKL
jgi:hypothetical protein